MKELLKTSRIITLLLVTVCILALASCGASEDYETEEYYIGHYYAEDEEGAFISLEKGGEFSVYNESGQIGHGTWELVKGDPSTVDAYGSLIWDDNKGGCVPWSIEKEDGVFYNSLGQKYVTDGDGKVLGINMHYEDEDIDYGVLLVEYYDGVAICENIGYDFLWIR